MLAFPAIYWLCLELFESSLVGWVAISLISVSPFHVLYAQEAREYSLWTVTILISNAALLYALRSHPKNPRCRMVTWGLYSVTLALGFYTFLLSGLVAIGQGIYVIVREQFRLTKKLVEFAIASFFGLILFMPWLLVFLTNFKQFKTMTKWTNNSVTTFRLIQAWLADLSRLFIDFNLNASVPLIHAVITIVIVVLLVVYAMYYLCRNTPSKVWLFPLTLIAATALTLMLPDIISGGQRSTVGRYLIPSYLSIQIAVAYTIADQITSRYLKNWRTKFWECGFGCLILSGLLSCGMSSQSQVWWKNDPTYNYPQVSQEIDRSSKPLLISDVAGANIVALSYLLDPKVRLQLVFKGKIPTVATGFSDVFLYRPSDELLEGLKRQNYNIEVIDSETNLWKIE